MRLFVNDLIGKIVMVSYIIITWILEKMRGKHDKR